VGVSGGDIVRTRITVLLFLISSAASASPQCTREPSAKWIAPEIIKAKISAMGHRIDVFKTTKGNCYEVYGKDKAGKNIEIYFSPMTGDIVEEDK
jgi:hypothetical protein